MKEETITTEVSSAALSYPGATGDEDANRVEREFSHYRSRERVQNKCTNANTHKSPVRCVCLHRKLSVAYLHAELMIKIRSPQNTPPAINSLEMFVFRHHRDKERNMKQYFSVLLSLSLVFSTERHIHFCFIFKSDEKR